MNDPKKEILLVVEQSSLDNEQKKVWDEVVQELDDDLVAPILEAIQDDERSLELLTKNMMGKIQALTLEENGAWDTVMEEEKKILSEIDE